MDYLTHNDLLWLWFRAEGDVFQNWVGHLALDGDFDWADGPLDAPVP
jgi:hypothetical protein